jgi:hypothetical protein
MEKDPCNGKIWMSSPGCNMPKFTAYVDALEKKLHSDLSKENLMIHTRSIGQWERESGSEGEKKSFDYIEKELRALKLSVQCYEFDSYISLPEAGYIETCSPESKKIEGLPPSFSASTPEEGLSGELVYIGLSEDSDYVGKNVSGKILLIDGLPSPKVVRRAEDHGAKGLIFTGDNRLHYMIITTLWGSPTYSRRDLIPKVPCISIAKKEGDLLKEWLRNRPVALRIKTKVWTGFKKIPLLTAHLKGEVDRERFLLLSGHVDSWHYGAYDNAGGNAAMLEVARLLQKHRNHIRRGVRFAFWSGHSQGRYSGSTWYADHFYEELYHNCIAHLNVDCIGGKGATDYSNLFGTEDTWDLAQKLIFDCTRQRVKARRCPRAGDQSFWGIGLPSLFMDLSGVPSEIGSEVSETTAKFLGTSGLPWWWHTREDTLDKIDPEILALDTRIYLSSALRFCNSPILPLNEETMGGEILRALVDYEDSSKGSVDLSKSIDAAKTFLSSAKRLNRVIDSDIVMERKTSQQYEINSCLMRLSRNLISLNYNWVGPFDHDLAVPLPPVPVLQSISLFPKTNPNEEDFKFLKTELTRLENRVIHHLNQSSEAILSLELKMKLFWRRR